MFFFLISAITIYRNNEVHAQEDTIKTIAKQNMRIIFYI